MSAKRRVLVAEDSPGLARVVQFNLQHAGFDVTVANDGQKALDRLQERLGDDEKQFELVVSDQQMPQLNGTELRERMREAEELAEIPFILLTAKGFEMNASDLKSRLGIDQILGKPFSPAELVQVIGKLLPAAAAS